MSCPKCKWDPFEDGYEYKVGGSVLRKISNFHQGYYPDDGYDWKEHYTCPKCKVLFTEWSGT